MLREYTNRHNQRDRVLDHLSASAYSRVVDIGGVLHPWAHKHVTHYIDLLELEYVRSNDPTLWAIAHKDLERAVGLQVDIGNPRTWKPVLEEVDRYGKFDFAICCHVLEHIPEPSFALQFLASIAHRGFCSVPSKYIELEWGNQFTDEGLARCGVSDKWRGAHCHRWILSLRTDCKPVTLMFWPKFHFVDHILGIDDWVKPELALKGEDRPGDLAFWWEGEIPFQIITDDFLLDDVNPENACELYRRELRKGL